MGEISPDLSVLVVDDFTNMRKIIKQILGKLGITDVDEAESGQMAIIKMRQKEYGLMLLDWNMPRMTGLEVIKQVRADERLKNIPIILVTAEVLKENIVAAAKAGVDDYVGKPFTADVLKAKMIKAIASRREKSGK